MAWKQVFILCLAGPVFLGLLFGCGSGGEMVQASAVGDESIGSEVRIVTLGGDVTEIVYALGAGDLVVGSDQSSTHPPEVLDLPRLNYHRQLSSESVLSLEPTHVLLTDEAGPPQAIEQIESAGVEVVLVSSEETATGVVSKIRAVAAAIDRDENGDVLAGKYEQDLANVREYVSGFNESPGVLFLYARQGMGAPMVGGKDSGANSMIELAGGSNAAAELEGYKALTPEALLEFEPVCILMMTKGFEAIGEEEGLLSLPGMSDTPAGRDRNIVTIPDDLLLTFGPRTPDAIRQLAQAIHGPRRTTLK